MGSSINNHTYLSPTTLLSLHKAGFKLVPLLENHIPSIQWSSIYDDTNYWSIEKLEDSTIHCKFINVASTVGKSHIKDSDNKELFIQVLDIDSEHIHNIISTPIAQLNNNSISNFLKDVKIDSFNLTLLDVLKKFTFVTKTRKLYGYHIWWLSHFQNRPILSSDCKKDYEFEIKTDKKNSLCTLPPSTHRDDKDFRYLTVGQTEKILVNDQLYGIFYELFKECIINKSGSVVANNDDDVNKEITLTTSNQDNQIQQHTTPPKDISFYNLSSKDIETSIYILSDYYKEGDRHNFALLFSGTAFHCRVSEESAVLIMEGICNITNDLEKQGRLYTLHSTYKNGIEGKPITGGPTFVELIERVKGCKASYANKVVNKLKKIWQKNMPKELSIIQAKRAKSGFIKVKGTIVGLSPVYNLIKSVILICSYCGQKTKEEYREPKFKVHIKEYDNCPRCFKEEKITNTVIATFEYVSVIDLELQDIEGHNEIERLPVRLFEKDTNDIAAGEVVNIIGNLHVIRKNDSIRNKLETFLFADSIEYTKRKELTLTQNDIEKIKEWKLVQIERGKNPIDELVSLFGPELIDLDDVKKGLLIVCVNAGFRNVTNRFPKRLRLNALLIGDPGLAKTTILEKATKLVPNSQYAGGQSSTGLSLTAQISKEDGGDMHTLRFGPVVLAKDSICAINELGQLPIEDHKHLLDCMEENGFPIAKFGFSTYVEAHPSIIASANPINNKWQNTETVSTREFPTLSQIIQRFDLIFIFRENTNPSYLARYVDKKKKTADDYKKGLFEGNQEFIKKYILHARSFKPELTEEAYSLLKSFYINMGKGGISGLPRKLDSLIRITIAISKLNLKDAADVEDAQEAMLFFNGTLKALNQATQLAANPRDIAYEQIRRIVKESNGSPISLTDAAIKACEINKDVKYYFGIKEASVDDNRKDNLKLNENWHIREVLKLLRNDESIQIVQEKPITIRWKVENEKEKTVVTLDQAKEEVVVDNKVGDIKKQNGNGYSSSLIIPPCDECDVCDDNNKKDKLPITTTTNFDCNNVFSLTSYNNDNQNSYSDTTTTVVVVDAQTNTREYEVVEDKSNNEGKTTDNVKLQNFVKLNPSSHPSHSLLSYDDDGKCVSNTESSYRSSKSDQRESDLDNIKQQIQLKHSSYAEIYTDDTTTTETKNVEDVEKVEPRSATTSSKYRC